MTRRRLHLAALPLLIIGVMALYAGSAQASLFTVNICTGNQAQLDAYLSFTTTLRQFVTSDLRALQVPSQGAISALAMADMHSDDEAQMAADAEKAKPHITSARSVVGQIEERAKALKRALDRGAFGNDRAAIAMAKAALTQTDTSIAQVRTALSQLLHAANMYTFGNRANEEFNQASDALITAEMALVRAGQQLGVAIGLLSAGCGDAATSVAPMSPSRVSAAAGGGGSRSASKAGYSVLAPKRLKLNKHGSTKLPLTLTQPAAGQVAIKLTRAKTVITYLSGSIAGARASSGLMVRVPRGTRPGNAQLTVTFAPATGGATRTLTLTIRMA